MGSEEKRVKDIMCPIDEYERISADAPLCEAIFHLKKFQEKERSHKTVFVIDDSGKLVGKLSLYDLVKGLVPEPARNVQHSRKFYALVSSRALEVAEEVGEAQKRFKWMHSDFSDLVEQEAHKKVGDVMSPLQPLLTENDTINKAIYIMFKENIRQPLVTRDGEVVGVINLMSIFCELIRVAGDECFLK